MINSQVSHAAIVPSTLMFLAKSPLIEQFDLSSLQDVSCGAAPLGEDLSKVLMARLPSIKWLRQGNEFEQLWFRNSNSSYDHWQFISNASTSEKCK